jgi:hypothetical protein
MRAGFGDAPLATEPCTEREMESRLIEWGGWIGVKRGPVERLTVIVVSQDSTRVAQRDVNIT